MNSKLRRTLLSSAAEFAAPYGLEVELKEGGRHPKLEFSSGAVKFDVVVSSSPRSTDQEQVNFMRQAFGRRVRALNIAPKVASMAGPETPHDRPLRRAAAAAEIALTQQNPPLPAVTKEPEPMPEDRKPITRNVLSFGEKVRINSLMSPHMIVEGAGVCRYRDGWDDEKVAELAIKELGVMVTSHNVAGIRKELYGQLKQPRRDDCDTDLAQRIGLLEQAFCNLAESLGENPRHLDCEELIAEWARKRP